MVNDNQPAGWRARRAVELRIGAVLLAACAIGAAAILPYQMHILASARPELAASAPPLPIFVLIMLFNAVLVWGAAIAIGLWLRPRTQLPMPWLEAWAARQRVPSLAPMAMAAAIGLATGLAIRAIDANFYAGLVQIEQPPLWTRMLAALYGGINEEVLLRFFGMSVIAALLGAIAGQRPPGPALRWISVILAALLFAAGHLSMTVLAAPLSVSMVARALLLNGIAGIVFGWLTWKRGLEAAIVAHVFADIALHVLAR
jgi:hypothetical protein